MIPQKLAPVLFGLILPGLMSLLVSGISVFRAADQINGFFALWAGAWLTAWLFAFPVVLLVAPLARAAVMRLTTKR